MNFNLKNVEVKHFKVVANEHFKTAETYVTKELYNKVQPLSSNVAAKVMVFASTMIAAASATMMDFTMDGRDGLWEVACAPHSWLSQAAEQHGLQPRRINLQSGFDLYQPKTWEQLDDLRRRCRPKEFGGACLAPDGAPGLL